MPPRDLVEYVVQTDGAGAGDVAIQAAIDTVGSQRARIKLTAATYRITKPLRIDNDYVTLEGVHPLGTTLQLVSGVADVAAVLQIGVTRTVQMPTIRNLTIEAGSNTGHTTGHGMQIDGNALLEHVYVAHAPQDGVNFTGTSNVFQTTIFDLYVNLPGRDGLSFDTHYFDTDVYNVRVKGGSSAGAPGGRYGIYNRGSSTHFYGCHPYFMGTDGLRADTGSVQINGGEYETNAGIGINLITQTGDYGISDINEGFYGNGTNDISIGSVSTGNMGTISSCNFRSSVVRNIIVSTSAQGNIQGCTFRTFTSEGILLNTGADNWNVTGNIFQGTTAPSRSFAVVATHCTITGNQFLTRPGVELTGADWNAWTGNSLNGTSITKVGANSVLTGNV